MSDQSEMNDLKWLSPQENPWGVWVCDFRPQTLSLLSASENPQCGENLCSLILDDGVDFIGVRPEPDVTTRLDLKFKIDELHDGALFRPQVMEHKWAIYYHLHQIIFVRSWQRKVYAVADVEIDGDRAILTTIHGSLSGSKNEAEEARVVDFALRTHALGIDVPLFFPLNIQRPVHRGG